MGWKTQKDLYMIVCGVDEAGRGALAGPVVAAAVVLPDLVIQAWMEDINLYNKGVFRDSKQLTARQREHGYKGIATYAKAASVGLADNRFIDDSGIHKATFAAMEGALINASYHMNESGWDPFELVLVDGKFTIPDINIEQKAVIGGDTKVLEIACASIIAKVSRDRIMAGYSKVYPQYHFDKHKGYGTKEHLELIKVHGPCPIHRKSFRGVIQ